MAAVLITNFMCIIGVVQTLMNSNMVDINVVTPIFEEYGLMHDTLNGSQPISYVIMSPSSIYTLIYSFSCSLVIFGSFVIVIVLTMKTVTVLKAQQEFMSAKTYALNKQIHYLLIIQVSF